MSVTISSINKYEKAAAAYCTEYNTVLAAMTTDPSTTNKGYQNTMVTALVNGGWWARMDQLFIFATEVNTGGEALINWKNPGTLNADNVHATAWTTLEGYGPGDGANDCISTNFIPNTHGSNYTQDDAAVGIYLMVNQQDAGFAFGAYTSDKSTTLIVRSATNTATYLINSGDGEAVSNSVANGLFILSRTASNRSDLYRNGSRTHYNTKLSGGLATNEILLLNRSVVDGFSTNTVAIFFVMDGVINETEATAINTIFETYMDAIGTGVQ